MRDDICTIPISEIFETAQSCPICLMRQRANKRIVEYITGSAMMEPDVRVKTNEMGFCGGHYADMAKQANRLSLALILKSRLSEINARVKTQKTSKINHGIYPSSNPATNCFICEKMEWGMSRMIETIYSTYEREADFRELFSRQHHFCFAHYELLINGANKKTLKKHHNDFCKTVTQLTLNYLATLQNDVDTFCDMFDYRNAGKQTELNVNKNAIEDAIIFDSN